MAHIDITLADKRKEIEAYVGSLEQDLEQARRDLSAINATERIFQARGPDITAYMRLANLFPSFELGKLAHAAMQASPEGIATNAVACPCHSCKGSGHDRQALAQGNHLQACAAIAAMGEETPN